MVVSLHFSVAMVITNESQVVVHAAVEEVEADVVAGKSHSLRIPRGHC